MKKTVFALALIASTSAFADVKGGKVGMHFQYGSNISSIGVWWHIVDMIAINPYVGYNSASDKYTNITNATYGCSTTNQCTRTNSVSTLAFGIDVPIYLAKLNAVNLFVAPGFSYSSKTSSDKYEPATGASTETKGTTPTISFGLALGLQIPILEQLHVFGKAGVDYSITSYDNSGVASASGNADKSTSLTTTRYSVGALFYFN